MGQKKLPNAKRANVSSFIFRRLAEALDQQRPLDIVKHGENILFHFKRDKVDWSELTEQALESLISDLKLAITEEEHLDKEKRNLRF